jgi:hypothetical protein
VMESNESPNIPFTIMRTRFRKGTSFIFIHNIVDDNLDISYLVDVKLAYVFNMLLVKDHFNSKHVTCIHSITFQ